MALVAVVSPKVAKIGWHSSCCDTVTEQPFQHQLNCSFLLFLLPYSLNNLALLFPHSLFFYKFPNYKRKCEKRWTRCWCYLWPVQNFRGLRITATLCGWKARVNLYDPIATRGTRSSSRPSFILLGPGVLHPCLSIQCPSDPLDQVSSLQKFRARVQSSSFLFLSFFCSLGPPPSRRRFEGTNRDWGPCWSSIRVAVSKLW